MRKICLVLLFFISFLKADITLDGYLHPGDNNNFSGYTPKDPITNEEEHTYDYYLHNPSKFYLSEDINVTKIELLNAIGIENNSNIRVYIDGNLIATGNNGSSIVNFNNYLTLTKGFHSIAVTGSCYVNQSEVSDCNNGSVDDIDDFYFSGIKILANNTTTAYNFIERHHIGDTNDYNDNYNIDNNEYSYYPDNYEGGSVNYNINLSQNIIGFRVFISRLRDIHENGINKLKVYDNSGNLILDYDLNHTTTDKFDFDKTFFFITSNGISKVSIVSGTFTSNVNYTGLDDLSWDEFIFIPYLSQESNEPIVEYRMDECSWDSDANTFEIKNYGSLGDEANATAVNGANVTDGKINNGGDFVDGNKALISKSDINLGSAYTINLWVKFPLNDLNHKKFTTGRGRNKINVYYFNIADRPRSDVDYIYFKKDLTNSKYYLCIYGDDYECKEYNFQNLNGWHMLSYVIDSSGTKFYVDDNLELTFTQAPINTTLGLLLNSDYGSSTDNNANGQSIGADVDEFKIFDSALSQSAIEQIYKNENNGKNWNGTTRETPQCNEEVKIYKFDAWDSFRNITDRNISTKIVNKEFNLTIASLDENNSNLQDFNGTVCVRVISNNYNSPWQKIIFNNENEKNESFSIDRAIKDARVNIEWKENEDINCPINDGNESNSSDDFAIRPNEFKITNIPTIIKAGEEFNITIKALDFNNNLSKDYNETISTSVSPKLEVNISKNGCSNGDITITNNPVSFKNGEANVTLKLSEVGDFNIYIKEVNESEFAKIDNDDTNENDRFIKEANSTISVGIDHFEINSTIKNYNSDNNFTYLDSDLFIYALLDINITAKNKDNETVENYNVQCYANDINISVNKILPNDINVTKLIYFYKDVNDNKSLVYKINKDTNISIIYKDTNFTTDNNGSTHISFYINFDRNISTPSNPFEMNITDVNVTDTLNGVSDKNENVGVVRFYYGGAQTKDIVTSEDEFTAIVNLLMYSNRDNDTLIPNNSKEIKYNWWENLYHSESDGNLSDGDIVVSNDYNASNSISGVDVSVDSIQNGEITLTITRNDNNIDFAVIHLLSQNLSHLWYSKFNEEYNISDNSTCLNHFCFTITWVKNEKGLVGSGDFSGTEANITETNSTRRGVKIFR